MKKNAKSRILKQLANLKLAIALLFSIGFLIAIGTIIEQDQSLLFYKENYPESQPVLGFLDWKFITFFQFNQIYTAYWFVAILILFLSSLLACTFTTQLPALTNFKRWKFLSKFSQFNNLLINDFANLKFANVIVYQWNSSKYHIFRQTKKNYAYKGLLGRVAPAIVHCSIVLLFFGSTIGAFGGYTAQEFIPRGEFFHVQNLLKSGSVSYIPQQISCRVNDFWITYTSELKIDQFYSDLSIVDNTGSELKRKIVFVNEPLVYDGLTFYQTDWDIIGLKCEISNNKILQIPLKKVVKRGKKFWFGSFVLGPKKMSLVVEDLQGRVYIYNNEGKLIQESILGNDIVLSDTTITQFKEMITSTGLQIKADPGIFTVYFSFLLLMGSIYVSFFTFSQIWLVEQQTNILIGGKSNRSVLFFQEEFRRMLNRIKKLNL